MQSTSPLYVAPYLLSLTLTLFGLTACSGGGSSTTADNAATADQTADQTAPDQPTGLATVNITSSTITLTWAASDDDTATTGYRLFRDSIEIATTSTPGYIDQGLAASTQYQYTVTAYDAAANESPSSSAITATTLAAADTDAPSIPSGLAASAITSSSITLSWTASTDNTATTGYRIFRDSVEIATSSGTQYVDQGLTANTQYQYTVTAYDAAANESSASAALTVMTSSTAVAGTCGSQTGTVVAIPFKYVTPVNVGKYITLAATSSLVEYNTHAYTDAPNINWSRRYKSYKYGDGGGAVTAWRLDSAPVNGTLYEAGVARTQGDLIADPDDLFYVPNNNFTGTDSFAYCAEDSTGQSNVATVSLQVAPPANYPMPIGIPDPGFGIDENPPADPPSWPSAETAGFYYIDSDHPSCSNANSYGYPATPRCTIPSSGASIGTGAKMVLASSTQPYTLRNSSWQQINFNGSPGNTSWLVGDERGPDKPVINLHANRAGPGQGTQLRLTGSNLRIAGVIFDGATIRHMGGGADNVVVRHSEFKNFPSTRGGGTTVGLSTQGSNVLAFNVYVHDNGIVESTGLSVERDIHAFVGSNQNGYWILDIRCDENAGDCVQLTNNNTSANVYVGRMVAHSEGENCIDIKDFNRVVVSESDCWDLRTVAYGNSGGNAQNFYVNDEGVQQNYVYFLNNRSWDTAGVNYGAANIGGRVYFVGNYSFASPAGDGLNLSIGRGSRYVYFNTFSNNERGIYHFGSGSALDRFIVANVVDGASLYQTRLQSVTSVIDTLDYNFYTDSMGDFVSGGSTPSIYSGLSAFQAAFNSFAQNSAEGVTPGFTNKGIYDFRLNAGSALIDAIPAGFMSSQPLFTDLSNDLGITTLTDINGTARPQGSGYDAGAFSNIP